MAVIVDYDLFFTFIDDVEPLFYTFEVKQPDTDSLDIHTLNGRKDSKGCIDGDMPAYTPDVKNTQIFQSKSGIRLVINQNILYVGNIRAWIETDGITLYGA